MIRMIPILQEEEAIHAWPVLYIKFVLLTTKQLGHGDIYYLVCCNHETLQKVRKVCILAPVESE
jgi:hypothetical protein